MKTLLHKLFFENWQRKYFSLFIAVIAWFVINHSLTATKTIPNVPVRIANISAYKTVLEHDKTISVTVVGNKAVLDTLNPGSIEIVVDAANKPDMWVETIAKKNLVSLNPEVDISGISQVSSPSLTFHTVNIVTEKIPVVITRPIGDAPRGYQFLDIWPYHLSLTVSGPEDVISKLKLKEQKLTFNLNDISKGELDALQTEESEAVSFPVPDHWKQILIPQIASTPLQINDIEANSLRIDFVRHDLIAVETHLPVTLFFPQEFCSFLNPESCILETTDCVKHVNGINILNEPLYARGVSKLFLDVVRDMMQLQILVTPNSGIESLGWSVQFANPKSLEDEYVARLKSEITNKEPNEFHLLLKEIYWRNRFRSYMSRIELYTQDGTKLDLNIQLEKNAIKVVKNES